MFLLTADGDLACTKAQAEWIDKEMVESMTKQLRVYENADHEFFTWSNQQGFVNNVLTNLSVSKSAAVRGIAFSAALASAALLASLQ